MNNANHTPGARLGAMLCITLGLATAQAGAAEPAGRPAECPGLASASVNAFTVTCAAGLTPVVVSGNLTGRSAMPDAALAFSGKFVALAYCTAPMAGPGAVVPAAGDAADGCRTLSSITGTGGERMTCPAGELPFALEGSAEGTLRTSRGIVVLHGDRNRAMACMKPSASI